MPPADSSRPAGPSGDPSPESEGVLDSANSWTQAANDALVAKRILAELQSIQQSQSRVEALLGRMLDSGWVLQPPYSKETSDTHSPTKSTLGDVVVQLKGNRKRASAPVSASDSDSIQEIKSDQTGSSTKRFPRTSHTRNPLSFMRPLTSRESSLEKQDGPEHIRVFNSMVSQGTSEEEPCSSHKSARSDLPPDAFIAATLPLSWPTVLAARRKYEKKNASLRTAIQNTAVACSRMWSTGCERTPLQAGKWRRWRYIISPGSTVHMIFSCFSFGMLLFDFTMIPVILAWDLDMTGFLGFTGILSVLFWTADMFLSFFTAFYVKGELVVSPAAIAKRYFRTWFLLDFLSVAGDWASIVIQALVRSDNDSKRVRLIRLVKVARLLRIIGFLRMLRFLNGLREHLEKQCSGYFRVAMKTVSLLLVIMFFTHAMCCAWYALGKLGPSDTGMRWIDVFVGDFQIEEKRVYQYVTSLHWAAAQMTLGATDVNSSNSMERCANIAGMLIGLIFSCTLVSSLSASLVDLSIAQKDQREKMEAIRKYLKENYISATTCLLVEDQASERLREEKKGFFYEGESCMQKLLSHQLFARLRHEVFLPTIVTHPLLRLWNSVHEPTMHRLSVEAFEFKVLQVGDDLFEAGGKANEAYFLIEGELEYTQHPDSSPAVSTVSKTVSQGTWLCEAALWSEWIHVGTAVARQRSTLALLKAEELLKVCSEHAVVKTIVTSYGESFHSKIVRAVPPEEHWPNDLVVPCTSLAQVVVSMPKEAQVAIGWNVLHNCSAQLMGRAGWAAVRFRSSLSKHLDRLEEEVTMGLSVVIQVGQEVQRVVSMACVRLLDKHDRVLVQIGKGEEAVEGVDAVCQLPGQKLLDEAGAEQKLVQVLEAKLPVLAGSALEIEQVEQEEMQEFSRFFLLKTTYFRTVITARFAGAWQAEPMPLARPLSRLDADKAGLSTADATLLERLMQNQVYHVENEKGAGLSTADAMLLERLMQSQVYHVENEKGAGLSTADTMLLERLVQNQVYHVEDEKGAGLSTADATLLERLVQNQVYHVENEQGAGLSTADTMLLERLMQSQVYHVENEKGVSGLYTWLPEEDFEELHTNSFGHQLVAEWIGRLARSFAIRVTVLPSLDRGNSLLGPSGGRSSRRLSGGRRLSGRSVGSATASFPTDYEQEITPPVRASARLSASGSLCVQNYRARQLNRHSLVSLSSASCGLAAGARLPDVDELEEAQKEELEEEPREEELEEEPREEELEQEAEERPAKQMMLAL